MNKKEYKKIWNKKNKDKIKENNKKYYIKNKDKIKKWGEKKKKKIKEYKKKYRIKKNRKKNKDKIKAQNLARKIKIPKGTICCICEERLATEKHHEDYDKGLEVWFCCGTCHKELDYQRQARELNN